MLMAAEPPSKLPRWGLLITVGVVAYFGLDFAAGQLGVADTPGRAIVLGLVVGGIIGVGGRALRLIGTDEDDGRK